RTSFDPHPPRRILVVVTVGGSTNSAPILEICRTLAARGHVIEFTTLEGRADLFAAYPFVSTVHLVGRAVTPSEDRQLYDKFSRWDNKTQRGRNEMIECKRFHDDQTYLVRYAPQLLHLFLWTRSMRKQAGVHSMPSLKPKPDSLVLINSFWGLEPAMDVPPLLQPVGPLLSDSYTPLDDTTHNFLNTKTSVVYVAFGTHVILTPEKVDRLMRGLCCALEQGSIDGIIWALRGPTRSKDQYTVRHLLANQHPSWLILEYAPQRAVLGHPSTTLFVTHAGPSSANEALFHGVPMVSMPFYGDQIQHNLRLVAAGVAKGVDKDTFTPAQLASTISAMMVDSDGELHIIFSLERSASLV
ncbi:UDP-Glycosyltransferase/glycogen phosphorylase, partial [Neurospora tetrasperma FGSC 2509]